MATFEGTMTLSFFVRLLPVTMSRGHHAINSPISIAQYTGQKLVPFQLKTEELL